MRIAALASALVPTLLAAQAQVTRVVVTDSLGNRVPFAWVQLRSGTPRTTDDSGRVVLEVPPVDSLLLTVRRIGYAPFEGRIGHDPAFDAHRVMLVPLARTLERVSITAPRENRLYRNGFYARSGDAAKTATSARFLPPEMIEARASARTTQLFEGIPFLSIHREEGKTFVLGRGRCIANVLIDGRAQRGMVEEVVTTEAMREIAMRARADAPGMLPEERQRRLASARRDYIRERMSYDELISPGSIAAIEAYASANAAPVELRNQAQEPTCALVAIWTGPRQ